VTPKTLAQSASVHGGLSHGAGKAVGKALRKEWTTPRRLVGLRTLVWVFAGLLLFVGETTLGRARSALRTIAKDTAPSIVAAEGIGTALADLDANVANGLLGNAGHRAAADAAIEKERIVATDGIVKAAENITNGNAERGPIGAITVDFGRYLEKQAEAQLLHSRGEEAPAKEAYFVATDLLHGKLLAAVDQLDTTKKQQMDVAYAVQLEANGAAEFVAAVMGLCLIGCLLWAQWFLFRRMRRIVNVPLLVATLTALGLTLYLVHCFSDTREDLRIAKLDAFDSIYALLRARAAAYDANGDESRYLLDASPARGFERDYQRKVDSLTGAPSLPAPAAVQLAAANPATRGAASRDRSTIKGMLWDEVRNITFPGEYDAAVDTLNAFARYFAIDGTMRNLKRAGKDAQAIELCIGTRTDESNAAFDRFDQAVQRTLDINQAGFDAAISRAEAELKRAELLDPGLALLIALAGWFGIRQRLREYLA
jgi:hypothetical protein